eukprot:m.74225 g.74225  ORF g.74225 m.74225 type:complete len:126 (+) comp10285_c0_seq1:176-553(+)
MSVFIQSELNNDISTAMDTSSKATNWSDLPRLDEIAKTLIRDDTQVRQRRRAVCARIVLVKPFENGLALKGLTAHAFRNHGIDKHLAGDPAVVLLRPPSFGPSHHRPAEIWLVQQVSKSSGFVVL